MKKVVVLLIVVLIIGLFAVQIGSATTRSWAQVSSTADQYPAAEPLTFDSLDGYDGVVFTEDSVEIQKAGLYAVVLAPQVTAFERGGCFEAWIRLNGVDVGNSNVKLCQGLIGHTDVIVSQGILELQSGDVIQFIGDSQGAFADAIPSNVGGPLIPSHISSVIPVGN